MTDPQLGGLPTTTTAPHLPARGADNEEQAAFRALKTNLLRKWTRAAMIDPQKTWGKHDPDSKIAMALEGCIGLGWSITTFDTRMEEYVTRAKAKRKRSAARGVLDDDDADVVADDSAGCLVPIASNSEPVGDDEFVEILPIRTGDQVSLVYNEVDGSKIVVAHGMVVDHQPPTDAMFKDCEYVSADMRSSNYWLEVRIAIITRAGNKFGFDKDHVFASDGQEIEAIHRDGLVGLRALQSAHSEGFLLWHQWVIPRCVAKPSKKRKRPRSMQRR